MANPSWRRFWKAWIASACLPGAGWSYAADADPFAPQSNVRNQADRASPTDESKAADSALRSAREKRMIQAARRTSAGMVQHGRLAFRRGLLPLRDYLEQLAAATEIDIRSAQAHSETEAPAWQQQVGRLRAVRDRLQLSNRPGPWGWSPDAALAEWALASAEVNLARARGDAVAEQTASVWRREWAAEHYRRRKLDADIGAASLAETSQAASFVVLSRSDNAQELAGAAYTLLLQRIATRTEDWGERGAAVGRTDRLLEAEVAVDLDRLTAEGDDGEFVVDADRFESADRSLRELFSTQLDYHRHGTAEVYDLAQTWSAWRDLHLTASDAPGLVSDDQSAERASALSTLQRLAERQVDRSGRFAADLAYVELLVQFDQLDATQPERAAGRGYLR